MSRSASAQSTYKLHKIPQCAKCKQTFSLVMAAYEDDDGKVTFVDEWECQSGNCGKTVPRSVLREEPVSEQDRKLHEWCIEEQRRDRKRKGQ